MYRRPCDVGPDESRATSQGRQALAASCRDCSAAWLPQEHTHVSWCRDCTEAFRQGRQAPARFTCPKCGLGYQAIKEWFPDDVSGGRFECIECFAEVHSWTGLYDYIGWIPVGRSS